MPINSQKDAKINVGFNVNENELANKVANAAARVKPINIRFGGGIGNKTPFGTISKESDEFQRSLASANARVLAFGVSAGALFSTIRVFKEITKATIEVEKSLIDINVVLGLSNKGLAGFSNELFNVANKTGQSFKVAATAALEFSRQGLSVEQTLKRTADALTLTRLSGLDVAKSVQTITAALNGFNDVTLTSEKLINKLATVDAAFAVSTADLANAFQRVGSTASDTGVQLDSLIALVTAAQQTTARGGSVIGNALKTIFQRIQKPEVLDTLREFNVRVEDSQGNILGADRILQNLAKTYETASVQQKNFIVGLAAGVFQSNQFRAILGDLAKENSIYTQALNVSANATDAAAKRQNELNKTLSASLQVLSNQITQAASKVGNLTIKPVVEKITGIPGFLDRLTGTFGEDAQQMGFEVGTGILKGLSNYLSGPGLFAAAALAAKLFGNFAGFAAKSFGTILEISSGQYKITQAVNGLLAQQPQILSAITSGALSDAKAQEVVLNVLRQQNIELARRGQAGQAVRGLINTGAIKVSGDNIALGKTPRFGKDLDYPNFANPIFSAISREKAAGIPSSLIKVGQSSKLKSSFNPGGLGIYNLRDEPGGINQGINRVLSQGRNPKINGIPNFAPNYEANIKSPFNDPFNRPPGTTILQGDELKKLEDSIKKYQQQFRLGIRKQEGLGTALDSLESEFKLTKQTLNKIRTTRFNPILRTQGGGKPFQSNLNGLTGDLFDRQFVGTGSGKQGEFLPITQQSELANIKRLENFKKQSFTENFLSKPGPNQFKFSPNLNELKSVQLYSSLVSRGESTQQLSARLASEKLQKLEKSAGIFTPKGRESARELRQASPDAYRQFESKLQNRAFLASIVAPIIGGALQGAGVATFGDNTTGRGVGQSAAGLGNVVGFAATGGALGGVPGALAGGVLGAALELPKIIKAFSDTLPDLQRRLGELQDISQKTSSSLQGFITTSEKLFEATQSGGITKGQLGQLQRERLLQLGQIPNVPGRGLVRELIGQNRFQDANEVGGNISAIQAQRQRVLQSQTQFANFRKGTFGFSTEGLSKEDEKLFKDFQESNTDLNRNKDTLRSVRLNNVPSSSKTVKDLETEIKKLEGQRNKSIEKFFSLGSFPQQFREISTGLLGLQDPETKTKASDILSKTDLTSGAKNIEDIVKNLENAFKGTGTSLETVIEDISNGLKSKANDFKGSTTFLQALFKEISKELSPENFKELASSTDIIPGSAEKAGQALFALNKSLLDSRKQFEALGTSIEITGIKRLAELTSSLDIGSIKQKTGNQISSLRGGGEGLRNFFDFQENQTEILSNLQKSKESLGITTGKQIFESLGQTRVGLKNSVFDSGLKNAFEGREGEVKDRVDKLVGNFDETFKPFIEILRSGAPISKTFLENISRVAEAELERAELTRKSNLLEPKEQASAEIRIKELNKFNESLIGIRRDFQTGRTGISSQATGAKSVGLTQFQENSRLLGERRAVNLENLQATGNFDVSQIARQAELSRSGLGQGFRRRIEIGNQGEFQSNIGSLLRESINNPVFGGLLNNRNISGAGDLGGLIDEQKSLVSGLQGTEQTEELQKQKDKLNALLDLQGKIVNLDKIRLENIKQQTIEEEKLLRFAANRIAEQRRNNEENSLKGNFRDVNKNLGNTFTETFSFNNNDYFNELSKHVADFGEEFKGAFKQGFAEMATGAKSAGDAFRSIGLNIAGSILTKSSGLAIDTLFASLLGNQKVGGGSGWLAGLFTKKNSGGLIKKYARGGYVGMGSGVRDDVPALLSGGEFVVNKKSTSKLGKSTLDILNESPEKATDIIKTSSGSEFNALFANEFFGSGSKTRPKSGSLNTSNLLSDMALTDENNPQNALRFSRERYFFDLKQYQKEIKKARSNFEKQQLTSLYSAYISAGVNFAGSRIGSRTQSQGPYGNTSPINSNGVANFDMYRNIGMNAASSSGPYKPGFARGGSVFGGDSSKDNLPAMLTGGEFVVNRNASNKIGLNNLNYMNKMGQFPRFAEGGQVGNDLISSRGNNKTQESAPSINISNQITVTLNDNGTMNASSSSQTSDNRKNNKEDKNEQGKQIGELVKNIVTQSLVRESKAGGLLYERFKTK